MPRFLFPFLTDSCISFANIQKNLYCLKDEQPSEPSHSSYIVMQFRLLNLTGLTLNAFGGQHR